MSHIDATDHADWREEHSRAVGLFDWVDALTSSQEAQAASETLAEIVADDPRGVLALLDDRSPRTQAHWQDLVCIVEARAVPQTTSSATKACSGSTP